MIEAGWARPAERVLVPEREIVAMPWRDLDLLGRLVQHAPDKGVEVWRDSLFGAVEFLFPREVPCVTALGASPDRR